MNGLRIVIVAMLVSTVSAGAFVWYLLRQGEAYFQTQLALDGALEYRVQSGDGIAATIIRFAEQGVIDAPPYPALLQWQLRYHQLTFGIQRGDYLLEPPLSLREALELLRLGNTIQRRWILVEGQTLAQALPGLASNPHIEYDLPHIKGFSDYPALARALGEEGDNPEGLFLADTYFFTRGEKASTILARARAGLAAAQEELSTACAQLPPLQQPLSPYQRAVLASIIEKETSLASERPKIAAVFLNRLARGMRLQTDPTVIYGIGDAYRGNITRKHLATPTPYNTYIINGLPPTPICNFGRASLAAVCNPDKEYIDKGILYFVGKGDGSHHFSTTYREHLQAVARYQLKRVKDYRSTPQ